MVLKSLIIHDVNTRFSNSSFPSLNKNFHRSIYILQQSNTFISKQDFQSFSFRKRNGYGRSGTFVAIYNSTERLKVEQLIDVVQCVRAIRIAQPLAVDNIVSIIILLCLTQNFHCYLF